jgi:hypothetical protein
LELKKQRAEVLVQERMLGLWKMPVWAVGQLQTCFLIFFAV